MRQQTTAHAWENKSAAFPVRGVRGGREMSLRTEQNTVVSVRFSEVNASAVNQENAVSIELHIKETNETLFREFGLPDH
jgi:hypothetical protein